MDNSYRVRPSFIYFVTTLLVVAALYLGRSLLIPLALAGLFAFLLRPLVRRLMHWGLPRVAAVVSVTLLCFSTLALVAWLLGGEMAHLASELPNHRQNIRDRIESLEKIGDIHALQRLRQLAGEVGETATPPEQNPPQSAPAPPPQADNGTELIAFLNMVVPTLASVLGTASVVILFAFFMLLRLDDIIQRLVRLVGYSRLTLTAKAMDEATERISRYLSMQVTINSTYGVLLATGLALIGLPYVILWGSLAAMFRFIPYVGPWIVAVLPIGVSLAVFDGWTLPLLVVGLIVVLELMTNMILEPVLYGHSAGVSDFALLVAIAFWTWIWGGIGLVLATPLTVCIVVFCKYIPSLEWVDVLMAEKSTPQPHIQYYRHHLATDEGSSQSLIESSVRKDGLEKTVEELVMPAVALTRFEELSDKLTPEEAEQMYQSMRSAFTIVSESAHADDRPDVPDEAEDRPLPPVSEITVFGRALQGEADALALDILATFLPPHIRLETSRNSHLIGELVDRLKSLDPAAVCISAFPPRSHFTAGILCRRLRSKLPKLKILVCRWSSPGHEADPEPFLAAGATWVASNIREACEILEDLAKAAGGQPAQT